MLNRIRYDFNLMYFSFAWNLFIFPSTIFVINISLSTFEFKEIIKVFCNL